MAKRINYGILGLGKIAHKFAHDLVLSRSSNLYAVGSRSADKAEAFRHEFGAEKAYGNYEDLLADPEVDIVYIATPHPFHYPMILDCLDHGKHVLCEKPICLNAKQVAVIIEKQKQTGLFVMEALWTKFLPAYQEMKHNLQRHSYTINSLHADFAFPSVKDPAGRLYNPDLAGGSLLDIGIYPVFLALDLMGQPNEIIARGYVDGGIDVRTSVTFIYDDGCTAQLSSDIESETKMDAFVRTRRGVFIMPERWHELNEFYFKNKNDQKIFKYPHIGIGYYHEIEHVNECLFAGKSQSDIYPLTSSLELIHHLDFIREQIGLSYKGELEQV